MAGIPKGSPMNVVITFLDATGAAFDPVSGIEIHARDPNGAAVIQTYLSAQLSKLGVGRYSGTFMATKDGTWRFKGVGTLANGNTVTTPDVAQVVLPTEVV